MSSTTPRFERDRRRHWDARYAATAGATHVSWYQAVPTVSRQLLEQCGAGPRHSLIDVGGGGGALVPSLALEGWSDLTVLDISTEALAAGRARCADADRVQWLVADLLTWTPTRTYDVWHDRAVFHFLVELSDRAAYRNALEAALGPSGLVVVGSFAPDAPSHCSGLPVQRYDAEALVDAFGPGFTMAASVCEEHLTPAGARQPFIWVALRGTAARLK